MDQRRTGTRSRRVAAMIVVLVVHHGSDALAVQPVSGAIPRHSTTDDYDIWCCHGKHFPLNTNLYNSMLYLLTTARHELSEGSPLRL